MSTLASCILVVRQGRTLGRTPRAGDATLAWIARHDPALASCIVVHDTGTGALPAVAASAGAVVLWLPAGLRERFPICYREASAICELATRRGAYVANAAAALANATPLARAQAWERAGLRCAMPRSYRTRAELEALLRTQPGPVVVRPEWTRTAHFAPTHAAAVGVALAGWQCAGSLMPFVDTRARYPGAGTESVWARLYHRKRAFIWEDEIVPMELLFSEAPIVGAAGSTFERYRGWRALLQCMAYLHPLEREAVLADRHFACGIPEHASLLLRAVDALGLRCATVDYSVDADGVPIFWSVNPCPDLHGWSSVGMPLLRGLYSRRHHLFAATASCLRGLVPDAIDQRRTA